MSDQECIVCGKPRFLILEEGKDPYCFSPLVCSKECGTEEIDDDENTTMSVLYATGWRWHFEPYRNFQFFSKMNIPKDCTILYMHPVD